MENMWVFLLLWVSGVWGQKDMKEKLFAFPKESVNSHVKLLPEHSGPFIEATVCMRFHSNLTREYSLFSLATESTHNAFLLFYYPPPRNQLLLSIDNKDQYYDLQGNNFTEWTSLCATWNSAVWAVWIDGKNYNEKRISSDGNIKANPIIIIGQEQDLYGGKFNIAESFVGEITDINMWDKALTDDNIIDYFAANEINGNILNWNNLNYILTGDVNKLPYADPYPCIPV